MAFPCWSRGVGLQRNSALTVGHTFEAESAQEARAMAMPPKVNARNLAYVVLFWLSTVASLALASDDPRAAHCYHQLPCHRVHLASPGAQSLSANHLPPRCSVQSSHGGAPTGSKPPQTDVELSKPPPTPARDVEQPETQLPYPRPSNRHQVVSTSRFTVGLQSRSRFRGNWLLISSNQLSMERITCSATKTLTIAKSLATKKWIMTLAPLANGMIYLLFAVWKKWLRQRACFVLWLVGKLEVL